jgi:hypothetical protein
MRTLVHPMRYQVTTPLTPREALEQALADFGPGGLGLQLTSQTNLALVLQGGGGHIAVTAEPGAPTTIGDRDTRVGLWRPAVYGTGPAASPVVATLVAAQATTHFPTCVVHGPRSLLSSPGEVTRRCGFPWRRRGASKKRAQEGPMIQRVSPCRRRPSGATPLVAQGMPLEPMQTLLGHAQRETPQGSTESSPARRREHEQRAWGR